MAERCQNCYACGKLVSTSSERKHRFRLDNGSLQEVLKALKQIVSKKSDEIDVGKLKDGFACRSCTGKLKKLVEIQEGLCRSVTFALPFLPRKSSQISTQLSFRSVRSPVIAHKEESPAVSARIHYRSQSKRFTLTPTRRRLCKPLIHKSYTKFARECLHKNASTRKNILKSLGKILYKEVKNVCSDKVSSLTQLKTKDCVINFELVKNSLMLELKNRAPTFFSVLISSLKTKNKRANFNEILLVIFSIICKNRRSSLCFIQSIISMILYAGHSSKMVFERLQKFGVCLSYSATINLIGFWGKGFDDLVMNWKHTVETSIQGKEIHSQKPESEADYIECISHDSSTSVEAPSFSSIDTIYGTHSSLETSSDDDSMKCSSIELNLSDSGDVSVREASCEPAREASSEPAREASCEPAREGSCEPESSVVLVTNSEPLSRNSGYKIVFDNIDKLIKPRFMRSDTQAHSLHYVQAFAVKDRIDYSHFSEQVKTDNLNLFSVLPTSNEYMSLKRNFATHISRIIVKHIGCFKEDFQNLVPKHITHKYSKEMSLKSEVVPLGVLPKHEILYEEMIDILEHYKQYVPSLPVKLKDKIPGSEYTADRSYITTLLGGDYLSVARARGSQCIRRTAELEQHRLDMFLPTSEDWHAKLCFLEVVWKRLYKTSSSMEKGTLYQIRNLINRRNITKHPKSNMNASEDFLETVVTGHILAAAMTYLGMNDLNAKPSKNFSEDIWMLEDDERAKFLEQISTAIVNSFVDLSPSLSTNTSQDSGSVYDYACEVLSLGLFFLDFKDAVREGDGDRVMLHWKYLLLFFKASGRTNYSNEALTTLIDYHLLLPPNLAEQLKWSRFVNNAGLPGRNISCDLHNEHLNRAVKDVIEGLGSNKSKTSIMKAARAIGVITKALESFDEMVGVSSPSGKHSVKTMESDIQIIIDELMKSHVFKECNSAQHKSFKHLKINIIKTLNESTLKEWMVEKFAQKLQQTPSLLEEENENYDSD